MINQKTHNRLLRLCKILFVIYLFVLAYLLFFFEMRTSMAAMGEMHYNLVPFREIHRFLTNTEVLGLGSVLSNVFGNILLFLPYGFLMPIFFRRMRVFWKMILAGVGFSLLVELIQLFSRLGAFDVDDLLLNTLGTGAGFVIFAVFVVFRKIYLQQKQQKRRRMPADLKRRVPIH